jgi:hypothetical protein
MTEPDRTAQGNRDQVMLGRSAPRSGIRLISKAFALLSGGLLAAFGGCSDGESGMVLGRAAPQAVGGDPSPSEGLAGHATVGSGGGAGAGPSSAGGAAGGGGEEPSWIDEKCTPAVTFENRDTTSKGVLFADNVPNPTVLVREAAHDACRLLYRSGSEVKSVSDITLIVEDYSGIASTSGTTLRLSSSYLQTQYDGGIDLAREVAGILHFTTSLVYQYNGGDTAPGWLMTGIADFVRLESGLIDRAERAKGGSYSSSSQTTAFFLDYLVTRNASVVQQLNLRLAPGEPAYRDDIFVQLMGSDLDTLWVQYQETL